MLQRESWRSPAVAAHFVEARPASTKAESSRGPLRRRCLRVLRRVPDKDHGLELQRLQNAEREHGRADVNGRPTATRPEEEDDKAGEGRVVMEKKKEKYHVVEKKPSKWQMKVHNSSECVLECAVIR